MFCAAPGEGEKPADALAGIQFQVPNGGSWDYRKGKNNNGKDAQQQQDKSVRGEESARIEQQDHGTAGQKMRGAMHKLGEKTRQLIALACAITTRCDGCIVVHTEAALKAGATKEEIAEALGVAVSMNAGAALIYSTRVLDAVAAKSGQTVSA